MCIRDRYSTIFKSQYDSITREILDELQRQEEERIQTAKDSLQKLLIYEVSMEQNHKYDIQQLNNIIEAISPSHDIKMIASAKCAGEERKSVDKACSVPGLILVEEQKSSWNRLFEFYQMNYFDREEYMDYTKAVEETKHYITTVIDEEYRSHFTSFRQLVKDLCSAPEPSLVESWKKLLATKKGRLAFIDALEEKVKLGKVKLSRENYELLAELLLHFLDKVVCCVSVGKGRRCGGP
eukprot:TRINITY_DN14894_c0_g1_i6.p1 TRINITY_DN14894_c0_g1~~TRINITY_DN14894_c0_g1_i6.p1  ORF type:complete len:238 (+),score=66.21 TRINITY_DN14894_c0_g1_i6:75-788(+)